MIDQNTLATETALQGGDAKLARKIVEGEQALADSSAPPRECDDCSSTMRFNMGVGAYRCGCGRLEMQNGTVIR